MDEERILELVDEYDVDITDIRKIVFLASKFAYLDGETLDSFVEEVCMFYKGFSLEELALRLLKIYCEDALCIPDEKTDDELLEVLTGVDIEMEDPDYLKELLYRP